MSQRPGRHIPELDAAREAGEMFYNGNPCKHGHPGIRYTSNQVCVDCSMARVREYGVGEWKGRYVKKTKPEEVKVDSPWYNPFK